MTTILVSGASGIVGYGILRCLRAALPHARLIGTTIYTDTPAEAFSDVFVQAVPTSDGTYRAWLLDTIRRQHVDVVIPGIEVDLHAWIAWLADIRAAGAVMLVNRPELVALCQDKWAFYQDLSAAGFDCAIETTLIADFDALRARFGLPFLLKPRRGFGGKGIKRIEDADSFAQHRLALGDRLMAQRIVGRAEDEYTIAAFGDGEGGFCACLSMRRTLSAAGFTQTAEVVDSEPFLPTMTALCAHYRPLGPTNFQFRRRDDGVIKLLEVNPRISSSTSIRAKFGYNEAAMGVAHLVGGTLPTQPVIHRGHAVRYIEDRVAYADDHAPPARVDDPCSPSTQFLSEETT